MAYVQCKLTATAVPKVPNFIGGIHAAQKKLNYIASISECAGVAGDAIAVVTEYSFIVDAAEAIPLHSYVKPAADGTGRAAIGTATDNCGVAIAVTATQIELCIQRHIHA